MQLLRDTRLTDSEGTQWNLLTGVAEDGPCNQCALMMGGCPCGGNAASGKPVCHECKGGWDAGDGAIPGKRSRDIKVMPRMRPGEEKK